jgi:hypothetical protein
MTGKKAMRLGFVGIAAVAAVGVVLMASQVFAASGTASVGSESVAPGEQGAVDVEALGVTSPGLGAWTIDVEYDPDVVTAVGCDAEQESSVCNSAYAADTVRLTGATATGLEGDSLLGTIVFECGDDEGTSPLEISLFTFADATLGGPMDIDADTVDGEIACEPGLPATGTGGGDSGGALGWLIAALAAVGVAGVAGFGALRLKAR